MAQGTVHQVAQLARRATAVSLACLAFALGSGTGAYLASQHVAAAAGAVLHAFEADTAVAAARGIEVGADHAVLSVAAAPEPPQPPEVDVHTVARALSVEPAAYRPLLSQAAIAAMTPGALAPAQVTFYYCAGGGAGDGGGFCGSTADGTPVQLGVAACDRRLMGQHFRVLGDPSGLVFRCADTGGAVHGAVRDMWFPTAATGGAWLAGVGHHVVIEVLE
jgi:3D (Asp-Asp-Asp) domain-containing protein